MHHHLEVILPPTEDLKSRIGEILAPFEEGGTDEYGDPTTNVFWDYWVLGGRWSGLKLEAKLGEDRIKEFRAKLADKGVTVSGLQMGKPSLSPPTQIPAVDGMWSEMFPEAAGQCPFFDHYSGDAMDVCAVADLPEGLTASAVIVAATSEHRGGKMAAETMIHRSMWNGVDWVDTAWDGTVASALDRHTDSVKNYREEYREAYTVKPDWLVATVDYHS